MARITRTQKYAELRNQLENGPEAQIKTKELEQFENKIEDLKIEEVKEEPVTSLEDLSKTLDESLEKEVKEEVTPKKDEAEYAPIDFEDIKEVKEEVKVEEVKEETPAEAIEPVKEETAAETVSKPEEVKIDDNYLEECLTEVNEYNKSKGLLTAEEVPLVIANELRNVKNEEKSDDDINDTVTMEIKKILSELDNKTPKEETKVEEVPNEEANEEVKVEAESVSEESLPEDVEELLKSYLAPEENKEESEDLEKTMVAASIADVAKEADMKDTSTITNTITSKPASLLNETVPLEVTSAVSKEDDDLEVEPGPNRILNIILISLIVILVLILGFVGYLILVAQGIIG